MQNPRGRRIVAALLTLAAIVLVLTVVVTDDGSHKPPPAKPIVAPSTVAIDGPDKDSKRDDKLVLGKPAKAVYRDVVKDPEGYDVAGDMRGNDPTPAGVVRGPLASQEWPGCKTAFVKAFSQRTSAIKAIALHYTAGPNIFGWGDLDGLTAYSNNIANQVSWHFSIDREGHCAYNVPITQKAWTISSLNSQTVNFEIAGTGKEADYAGTAGIRRVARVVARVARIEHIPIRLGATDGHCNVTRRGIITHWMGGPCSGGHIDIKPFDIVKVIAHIRALTRPVVSKLDQLRCERLNRWRANGRPARGTRPAVLRKHTLIAHKVICEPGKKARR
jgi:hypothetical protein